MKKSKRAGWVVTRGTANQLDKIIQNALGNVQEISEAMSTKVVKKPSLSQLAKLEIKLNNIRKRKVDQVKKNNLEKAALLRSKEVELLTVFQEGLLFKMNEFGNRLPKIYETWSPPTRGISRKESKKI